MSIIEDPDPGTEVTLEDQLAALAKEYAEARDLASEAAARKDEARERIIALMGEPGNVAAGGFFISVTEQSRTTLDTKALRRWAEREGFDLAPYKKGQYQHGPAGQVTGESVGFWLIGITLDQLPVVGVVTEVSDFHDPLVDQYANEHHRAEGPVHDRVTPHRWHDIESEVVETTEGEDRCRQRAGDEVIL